MLIAVAAFVLATSTPLPLADFVKAAGAAEVASEAASRNRPCTMTIDAKELDKKGGVKDTSEIVLRRTFVDGKQQNELLRYVENGKDITAEKKAKRAAEKKDAEQKDDDRDKQLRSPFHPENAGSHAFEDLGADALDPTLRRVKFSPKKGSTGDGLMIGEATLTLAAQLRSIRMKPAELPMLVNTIDIVAAFGASGEVDRMELAGEAGALFIKKRFRVITSFDWE